ncbi:MAG: DEAD/DEAH box helicase family protein [Phycisphaerales bacterium]|nr:DEAD/DEAH box helicase family protein [Phycisphaerales bacterium]
MKCSECSARDFVPVSDAVIHDHLIGVDWRGRAFVAGIYPMMLDETCFFLAADFDGDAWREDSAAFMDACRRHDVPAALERSRSGNGGHVWIFFVHAIPAALARRLGTFLLTEAMETRPKIGLASYDRLFPNQDTLPKGGFGNLIALPLQGQTREVGNSVFLDDTLRPFDDQWAFLSSIRKMERAEVEGKVADAERRGSLLGVRMAFSDDDTRDPWTLLPSRRPRETPLVGTLPEVLHAVLCDGLYFRKDELTPSLTNRLTRLAAFQNPAFYRAQAMRLSTHATPRVIACAEDYIDHISLPRGCMDDVHALLADAKIKLELSDDRHTGTPQSWSFQGKLRPDQQTTVETLAQHDTGVLSATTAFGKTVIAAWIIAQRKVNTLIVVHTKPLLEQWIERLSTFLGISAKSIGRFGGGKKKPSGHLDVALMQSLVRHGVVNDHVANYGHVIFDECHHLSAHSFEAIAKRVKAKYLLGLSATLARKDGHHPIIFMQCGPLRHRVGQ